MKKTSSNYKINQERPCAIVNFDSILMTADYGRYFYIICIYLNYCGFDIIAKTNWEFFKSLKPYQKLLLKQQFQLVRNSSTPINTVELISQNSRNKFLNISYGYTNTISHIYDCIAPYPMHPMHVKRFSNSEMFLEFRKSKRTIKIFFSGNVDKTLYNKEKMKKEFDVLDRWEVINFIKTYFKTKDKIQAVKDKLILYNLMNSKVYVNAIIIAEVDIAAEDWLKMLSKVDFFICPPGSSAPWCHNSIEAMSVGTIPILQYADLFTPALESKKNCLAYTNYNELQKVIESALEMKEKEIEIMRNNVINYYDRYLSIESIAKKISGFSNSNKQEITVAIPYIMSDKDK